ncbi:MAG: response regulator transcription factor [Myxococcales bacterium]|nr:response regulator transcription factor [Myxococcales bacterium]
MSTGLPEPLRLSVLGEQTLHRDCLCRMLEASGLQVGSQHSSAHPFLLALGTEKPQVAVAMDGSDALTVLQEAHQLHPEVRLLVLAPRLDHELLDACFRAGASGYVDCSSARLEALVDAVHAVARGNNVFPANAVEDLLRAAGKRNESSELLRALSEREREVLAHLAAGADNLRIANALRISERTVKAHVSNLYRKLGQDNRTQLALLARQSGLRPPALPPRSEQGTP